MKSRALIAFNYIFAIFLLCAPSPGVTEEFDPTVFPGNRYAQENSGAGNVSYWKTKVRLQFVGLTTPELQMAALTSFLSVGAASRSEIEVVGFPSAMFQPPSDIGAATNLLVFEFDPELNPNILNGFDGLRLPEGLLPLPAGPIREIGASGLIEQSPGCLARWRASPKNEIEGFVLAVSSQLKTEEKVLCLSTFSAAAYGVFPFVSLYDFSDLAENSAEQNYSYFADTSEIQLIASAAAFCRTVLRTDSVDCPYRAISRVFAHHDDLLNEFGKQ